MRLMKKKILSVFFAAALAAGILSGCGGSGAPAASAAAAAGTEVTSPTAQAGAPSVQIEAPADEADKCSVVATIYPEYDWLRNIIGENADHVELRLLLDKGVDMHSFQPTADDMMTIASSDLFVYVGGESDVWVADALKGSVNPKQIAVNLMETLGSRAKEEELVEGMQAAEHDHGHDHEHEGEDHEHESEDHDHEHEGEAHEHEAEDHGHEHEGEAHEHAHGPGEAPEYDEHVWLSLKNAEVLTERLADALAEADPARADSYHANAEKYLKELAALDAEYEAAVAAAPKKTVLFGDRFPFRYLTDDYDLDYYAAFAGCSAETEASFETIIFLAEKVDELGLNAVLTIENSDQKIAKTIVSGTKTKDQKILSMDSMQSVTAADAGSGPDYLARMRGNLEVLKEALQ